MRLARTNRPYYCGEDTLDPNSLQNKPRDDVSSEHNSSGIVLMYRHHTVGSAETGQAHYEDGKGLRFPYFQAL